MSNDKKELKQLYNRIEKMYGIYIERTFAEGRIKRMRKGKKLGTKNFNIKNVFMALTSEQRQALEQELAKLQNRLKSEFVSPIDIRRMDEINSLLMTNGESSEVKFKFHKGRESQRVTSFTKNRR